MFFYNIRSFINEHIVRTIYYACLFSKIKYGIEIYGSADKTKLNNLQTIQNKLLKILLHKTRRFSTNKLHSDLRVLKVEDIYRTSLLHFVYNCQKGTPIENFRDYFKLRGQLHEHRTRSIFHIHVCKPKTNYGKNTSHYRAAQFWNQIADSYKDAKSINIFKKRIFTLILSNYG